MSDSNIVVVSLGGSIIVPDVIDTQFLADFTTLVQKHVALGKKFLIICGGGRTCRNYQNAVLSLAPETNHDYLDWIGIASLRLNAELLRAVFAESAFAKVLNHPDEFKTFEKDIVVCGAYEPGKSSDFDAVHFAEVVGAKKVVNLSNIEYAYDSDPRTNPNAKRLESVSWAEYRSYIPAEWKPGLSTPFDPIASKRAEESGIEVAIMNGANLENFEKYLNGEEFVGTKIF